MRSKREIAEAATFVLAVVAVTVATTLAVVDERIEELEALRSQERVVFLLDTSNIYDDPLDPTMFTEQYTQDDESLSGEDKLEEFRGRTDPLEPEELAELLVLVGFELDTVPNAWAVAMKESTGDPLAHNTDRSTGDNSYGLFQINMLGRLGPSRRTEFGLSDNIELFDPVTNAQVAFQISKGGTDFGAWGIGPNAYRGSSVGSYPKWLKLFSEEWTR